MFNVHRTKFQNLFFQNFYLFSMFFEERYVKQKTRLEGWPKNNVRSAVNSGEKKLYSPESARIF